MMILVEVWENEWVPLHDCNLCVVATTAPLQNSGGVEIVQWCLRLLLKGYRAPAIINNHDHAKIE